MTETHQHQWLPLIRCEGPSFTPPCGSIGSQIGYACNCGEQRIYWPDMIANEPGWSESAILELNARVEQHGLSLIAVKTQLNNGGDRT